MTVKTYPKPAVRHPWADDPPNGASDFVDPGDTYADQGWQIGNKPPRQYFNWVLNWSAAAVRYFCQQGVPDWDANEVYPLNGISQGSDNKLYQSLVGNNSGINPVGDGNVHWGPVQGANPNNADRSGSLATTGWVGNNFLAIGSGFGSIAGQISPSQVPVGAVTQWQGSLSIGGGQITSAVGLANAVTSFGAGIATFNYSGQSGQPNWLWGTNNGTSFFVWNPANFSVANAGTLAGLTPTTAAAGNTVMVRDSNGYAYSTYFNQNSPNNENPPISQVVVTNGTDGFLRKASLVALVEALGGFGSQSTPGWVVIPGTGIYLQWGQIGPVGNGNASQTFPVAFPHACFAVITDTNVIGGPGGAGSWEQYLQGFTNNAFTVTTTGASTNLIYIPWFAVGW